jgi:hypothetical protein
MSRDGPTVYAYPSKNQYDRWEDRREQVGVSSQSQFICDMVEAGIKADKGFSATVAPDETARELRQQRNDLKDELARARERIEQLEDQLHSGERETIEQFVAENPGAAFEDIVRHVADTVPERLNRHLNDMDGDAVVFDPETEQYYPPDADQPEGER